MDPQLPTDITGIPQQYQVYGLYALAVISMAGKILGALANRGGLKNILLTAWKGNAVPIVIAKDYKEELNTKAPLPTPEKEVG